MKGKWRSGIRTFLNTRLRYTRLVQICRHLTPLKYSKINGGEGGIRTREPRMRLRALQARSFDHSDTSPQSPGRSLSPFRAGFPRQARIMRIPPVPGQGSTPVAASSQGIAGIRKRIAIPVAWTSRPMTPVSWASRPRSLPPCPARESLDFTQPPRYPQWMASRPDLSVRGPAWTCPVPGSRGPAQIELESEL